MGLARLLAKRLLSLAAALVVVTFLAALLLSLVPGDPVNTLIPVADDDPVVVERKDQLREELNLDKPVPVRYWGWLTGFATGDFGNYYRVSGQDPVSDRVSSALPVSLQLMAYSMVVALVVAVPLGVLTAYRAGTRFDRAGNTVAFGLLSVPTFVMGLLLAYYVGVWLGWLPVSGYVAFGEDPVEHIRRMILPTLTLASGQIAIYMRLLRSDMVATLQEDFVQMARSKGISDQRVLWRHALRPSTLTVLTVAGLNVGALISFAVVVEVIFQLPGLGLSIVQALDARQYVAFQAFVAILAIIYVVANFAVDLLYSVIDPRIRHEQASR